MLKTPEHDAQKAMRMSIIEAFASIIKDKRTDAIEGRRASGIEDIWAEDEAHYAGQDDAGQNAYRKGRTPSDGLTEAPKKAQTRSTAFLNITRPYCDAAAASLADMLLPNDDRNWALQPTPLPQLTAASKDMRPISQAIPMPQAPAPGPGPQGAPAQAAPPKPEPTVAEVAKQELGRAKEMAEAAQTQIDDWLIECRYHAEVRKVLESAAKIGTGVLKGPVPVKRKSRAVRKTPEGWIVEMVEEIKPESRWVNVWNIYPDPSCGDNIHDGSYIFEEDEITALRLDNLKGTPGYIDEMIDMCLMEGPISAIDGTSAKKPGDKTKEKDVFQVWYFYGQVSRADMESAGCVCGDKSYYPAQVTMVNNRVIKVALSPLDSGEFPYDVMCWSAQTDHWAGVGIARQMRTCQKGANAAVRNLMDNAGLSAGPQVIVDRSKVMPANGKWELTPRKVWWTKDGADAGDVRTAFVFVVVPMLQQDLMAIIQFWLKEAEDVTGMPALLQGQQGKAPDTVGGMTILNNNASTVKRRIARTYDDRVTEPHIGRYYEYLLLHGPDECKGDFTVDARGSSALIERDTQSQQLPQMLQMSVNPAFGLDPEAVMAEMLKGWRFDTKRLALSDEKKEAMKQQPPPPQPAVQVAQIREEGATKRKQMDVQVKQAEIHAEATQSDADRAFAQWAKKIDAELAGAQLTAEERRALDDAKVTLAGISMKLRVQQQLTPGPQVVTPASEPAGKAPKGMAFER